MKLYQEGTRSEVFTMIKSLESTGLEIKSQNSQVTINDIFR